jgi:hypothetical protein
MGIIRTMQDVKTTAFTGRKRECLIDTINELAMNSKNKDMRNEFKANHQTRSNPMKDENGDLLADSHSILNMWKKYFSVIEGA